MKIEIELTEEEIQIIRMRAFHACMGTADYMRTRVLDPYTDSKRLNWLLEHRAEILNRPYQNRQAVDLGMGG